MSLGLAISNIVNVSIALAPLAAGLRNFGNLLIAGATNVIDVTQRIRTYSTLAAVGVDFGTSAPEYKASEKFFSQNPTPAQVSIGRWAQTATAGLLQCGALSSTEQLAATWAAITTGTLKITTDGTLRTLTAIDFTGVANMNAVAGVINTKLAAGGACVWNAAYNRLEITSPTTGAASTVTYAAVSTGVDIGPLIKATAATGAQPPVDGIIAETLLQCVAILAAKSNDWYGLYVASTSAVTADYLAVAGFIEAATPSRIFGVTTQDANTLVASSTTDLAYQLKAGAFRRSFDQYNSASPYAAASIFGRAFTVDFEGANTTITVKFKTEPGVVADTLTQDQADAVTAKNCNIFVNYDNSTAIVQQGVMASGAFFDEIQGLDWLQDRIQSDAFNVVYANSTKIPQTDAGMALIGTAVAGSCEQAVTNGLFAPGVYTGPSFGAVKTGDTLAKGYYVFTPPISSQSPADRAARKSVVVQFAGVLAGAVHSASVVGNVVR